MNAPQEFELLSGAARALTFDGVHCVAALVTIIRTHGSTFRRAGSSMLVHRDGRMVCELSGGCPQRDIVLQAQRVMESGEPTVVAYGRDNNYDVMIETGCGGELEVLIEPWREPADLRFLDEIDVLRRRRVFGTMASLLSNNGGVPARRVLRLIESNEGVWTDIPSPILRNQVLATLASWDAASPVAVDLVEHEGGHHQVLLERLRPPHALVVIGGGIGAAILAQLSRDLGWHTTVVSTTELDGLLPRGVTHLCARPYALATELTLDDLTSVVVMTHQLERDLAYLAPVMASAVRYVGVIGSKKRAEQIRAAFPGDERLHVPAGLDIGSETPREIALAIAAEILASLNGRSGGPLVHTRTAIHASAQEHGPAPALMMMER